jgi:hypothetical protein
MYVYIYTYILQPYTFSMTLQRVCKWEGGNVTVVYLIRVSVNGFHNPIGRKYTPMEYHINAGDISNLSEGVFILHMECYGWPHALPMQVEGEMATFIGDGHRWMVSMAVSHRGCNEPCSGGSLFMFCVRIFGPSSVYLVIDTCFRYLVSGTMHLIPDIYGHVYRPMLGRSIRRFGVVTHMVCFGEHES